MSIKKVDVSLCQKSRDCSLALDFRFDSIFAPILIGVAQYVEKEDHLPKEVIISTTQGMLVTYWFTVWEEYFTRDEEKLYLSPSMLEKLNAYRHIRHSAAHGIDFSRAKKCRNEFESIMNSSNPIIGVEYTDSEINLAKSEVSLDCRDFLKLCSGAIFNHKMNT